jgi:16S rRNA (guanine527-N7)-methyltransferase
VCEYALPLLAVGGHAVLWRGSAGRDEADGASRALAQLGGKLLSVTPYRLGARDHDFHLVVVQKVRKTPGEFPRAVGIPKQNPL